MWLNAILPALDGCRFKGLIMFEGKPPLVPQGHASQGDCGQSAQLRELTWADLRARLEAAQELRTSMGRENHQPKASFDAGFASCLASRQNGKEAVNPDDSANGKGDWPNNGATHSAAKSASRGNT